MGIWQGRSDKKATGGRLRHPKKKRKTEIGGVPFHTFVGEDRKKLFRTRGGSQKVKLLGARWANVIDQNNNKAKKTKIIRVVKNPANIHYVRRNIVTKGAIIETEDGGLAKVTSRPTQHGVVNAVKVKED